LHPVAWGNVALHGVASGGATLRMVASLRNDDRLADLNRGGFVLPKRVERTLVFTGANWRQLTPTDAN
jgi:hypothetical protein